MNKRKRHEYRNSADFIENMLISIILTYVLFILNNK